MNRRLCFSITKAEKADTPMLRVLHGQCCDGMRGSYRFVFVVVVCVLRCPMSDVMMVVCC